MDIWIFYWFFGPMALSNPLIHLPVISPVFRAKQLRTERPPDHGTWTARRLRRTWSCGEANYGCFWISMAAWGFIMIYDFLLLDISGQCNYIYIFTLIYYISLELNGSSNIETC